MVLVISASRNCAKSVEGDRPRRACGRKLLTVWMCVLGLHQLLDKVFLGLALQELPATNLGSGVCQREPHLKTRVSGFRGHLYIAFVLFHNSLDRVEA